MGTELSERFRLIFHSTSTRATADTSTRTNTIPLGEREREQRETAGGEEMQGEASNGAAGADEHVSDESRGPYFPFNRREKYPPRLKVDFRRLPASVKFVLLLRRLMLRARCGVFVQHVVLFCGRTPGQLLCSSNQHLSVLLVCASITAPSCRENRRRAARPSALFPSFPKKAYIELNSTPSVPNLFFPPGRRACPSTILFSLSVCMYCCMSVSVSATFRRPPCCSTRVTTTFTSGRTAATKSSPSQRRGAVLKTRCNKIQYIQNRLVGFVQLFHCLLLLVAKRVVASHALRSLSPFLSPPEEKAMSCFVFGAQLHVYLPRAHRNLTRGMYNIENLLALVVHHHPSRRPLFAFFRHNLKQKTNIRGQYLPMYLGNMYAVGELRGQAGDQLWCAIHTHVTICFSSWAQVTVSSACSPVAQQPEALLVSNQLSSADVHAAQMPTFTAVFAKQPKSFPKRSLPTKHTKATPT